MSKQTFPFLVALEHSHVPSVILLPRTGEITWLNPAAKALVGDIRGRDWRKAGVLTGEGLKVSEEAWNGTLDGGCGTTVTYETEVRVPEDGRVVPVSVSSTYMDAGGVPVIFGQFYPKAKESPALQRIKQQLSDRQVQILKLIAAGESNKEIAQDLQIAPETVKTHVRRIMKVLDVGSRAAAVALAIQQGLM